MTINDLAFPLLYLNYAQGVIEVAKQPTDLTRCTSSALKDGWFKDLYYIDSRERYVRVIDAHKVGSDGAFWGFNLMYGRTIWVELVLQELPKISLEKTKEEILTVIDSAPELWEAMEDIDEFKLRIRNAQSVSELITLFEE